MGLLGRAIGRHLSARKGLYSVELPVRLRNEMLDLVATCNAVEKSRAVLVGERTDLSGDVVQVCWAEVLGWRTADDRVFVWTRNERDPDTSFRDVVRPFISARFPGTGGGECSVDLLASLCVEEVWRTLSLPPVGPASRAFDESATWIAEFLVTAFERVGSRATEHWTDRFLEHWALTWSDLEHGMRGLGSAPDERHAWELLRLAGVPVPARESDTENPFLVSPIERLGRLQGELELRQFARWWQLIVDEFVIPRGRIEVLLMALDLQVPGAQKPTPWRRLDWTKPPVMSPGSPAPMVGRAVFASATSPTVLTSNPPAFPIAPMPAWWGVNSYQVERARSALLQTRGIVSNPSCVGLTSLPGRDATLILMTRNGAAGESTLTRRWRMTLQLDGLSVRLNGPWTTLLLARSLPPQGAHGTTVIDPDSVKLHVTGPGVKAEVRSVRIFSGDQLEVEFDVIVTYSAANHDTGSLSGSWHPVRTLRLTASARDGKEAGWGDLRPVDHSVDFVVPSCFAPTLIAYDPSRGKLVVAPDRGDTFARGGPSDPTWNAGSTPDLLLAEEGWYTLVGYDGRITDRGSFAPEAAIDIAGRPMTSIDGLQHAESRLDDGDAITGSTAGVIAVAKVRQRSRSATSGLVAAIRNAGSARKPPSSITRASVLGLTQSAVINSVRTSRGAGLDSLFQYVLGTTQTIAEWIPIAAGPAPTALVDLPAGYELPGVRNGLSPSVAETTAWERFVAASHAVLRDLGICQGGEEVWLSATNPGELSGSVVREFVESHCELIAHAKSVSPADAFWASYPFSVIVVDDAPGASLGQVQAVFLSPLHPVRLAWAFSVARLAQSPGVERALLGLAEGWNLPLTGTTVSVTGQPIPMVALPIDPGEDADFATWSALGVLGNDGVVRPPGLAAGLELPWGGPSGINEKVVNQAITDYLSIHPYLNSLEVDVRSVSPAPRAREIDDALLRGIGGATVREVSLLGGSARVWDSGNREGDPPSRDRLLSLRDAEWRDRPFEWRRYSESSAPSTSDVALIESASAHMGVVNAVTTGVLAPLPLRRFTVPTTSGQGLDQQYAALPGDDVLGIARLLAEIEYAPPDGLSALRVTPRANALGIGSGARWEVLGTLNIDPALLSSIVRSGDCPDRMLWEWRPSWLAGGQGDRDQLAKRAHYVVARVPRSLVKGLATRQGLAEPHAQEMITELGRRGIGLASLQAAGGTQESAAAGHFYATRVLLPPKGHAQPQNWITLDNNTFAGILPIDPVAPILFAVAGESPRRRADLLVFKVKIEGNAVRVNMVPIEVKHHGQPQSPSALPSESDRELKRARDQLKEASRLVKALSVALDPDPGLDDDPARAVIRRQACAVLIDLALSFADDHVDPVARATILRYVVQGRLAIDAGPAMLLWFAPESINTSGAACIVREGMEGSIEAFIDPAAVPGIWWQDTSIGPDDAAVRNAIDGAMSKMIASRKRIPAEAETDLGPALLALLDLGPDNADASPPPEPNGPPGESPPAGHGDDLQQVAARQTTAPVAPAPEPSVHGPSSTLPNREIPVCGEPAPSAVEPTLIKPPLAYVGWNEPAARYCLLGRFVDTTEQVALDLDNPKAIGVFGYMGSGKSYLLGTLVESSLVPIPGINSLPSPLAVVIFNYRRHSADRFELASLAHANTDRNDRECLEALYHTSPRSLDDIQILCLPGQLTAERAVEYGGLPSAELFFDPSTLGVEDWELLMGEPGSNAVFARAIRNALMDLQAAGDVSLASIERTIANRLTTSSQSAATLRLDFVRRYLSTERGMSFGDILRPGRAVIIDLRQPLFNKDDALRFFLVCSNHISRVQGGFNKLVVFDEAHEYLSDAFGEKLEARIRLMRHEGTSYVFATQDVGSIPLQIRRFITTRCVFSLGTRDNCDDLVRFAPEFADLPLQQLTPGTCYVQSIPSRRELFARPRLVQVRPRVTQHGGTSRIFAGTAEA